MYRRSKAHSDQLEQQRRIIAKQLASLLLQKQYVIFADESSTRIWHGKERLKKTWMHSDQPLSLKINSQGLKSITMIGATTNFTDRPILEIGPKSDLTSWKNFMLTLKQLLDELHITRKVYLVIDNLSAHHSRHMHQYYEPFKVIYIPAYSCEFNAQEFVWSALKQDLAKHFAGLNRVIKQQTDFEAEVDFVMTRFTRTHQNAPFIRGIHAHLKKYTD